MLLTRLAEHAERIPDLPPPFYRNRTVRWSIRLNTNGIPDPFQLRDLASSDNPAGQPVTAPYIYRAGPRPPAMLLVDDLRYVTGFSKEDTERERTDSDRRNQDYVALVARWRDSALGDPIACMVASFFERGLHKKLAIPPEAKPTDTAAIMLENGLWAHHQESAAAFWATVARERKTSANEGICLVCGQLGPLLNTIPEAVKSGAIPAGSGRGRDAQLVSVNKPAQGRGGKIQLASAPVCDGCGSSAMSALNALLADRSHRYRTADSVLAWWVRGDEDAFDQDWLNEPEPQQVEELISSLHKTSKAAGVGGVDPGGFCAVTLSVNQSRVVVRDWLEVPVDDVQRNLGRWFAGHRIVDLWQDGLKVVPLWLLARCTGRWGTENGQDRYLTAGMAHGCERDLLFTALRGTPSAAYLLPHLLHRIRADGRVDLPRAALLRLILVRSKDTNEENYMTGLNPDLPSPPYQCGRMFAVLEQIQRAALGRDVNTTIADKYLAAATATPLAILTMLEKNSRGHLKRLRRSNTGAYYALSDRLDDVAGHLDATVGIPRTLGLPGQAEFILGYHHQRAADNAAARARKEEQLLQSPTSDTGDPE
jgi:CRISPR-associated protein Csd1